MKLKNIIHVYGTHDFEPDLNVHVLTFKGWSLLQFSLGWSKYADWPYLQITMGNNMLFGVFGYIYKFSFSFDFLAKTWVHYQ